MGTATYDVVVIGAGMTGAGVALDATTRGLRVALIDAGDFASGTSSKSSKMVHGGLRYLQQREFRLVYENLRERQRLLENAPFLVRPLPFLIPIFGANSVGSRALAKGYATALRLYELAGGWRIGQHHRKVTAAEALEHVPALRSERLVTGFVYLDARGDDARVVLTLVKTAVLEHGAHAVNYVRAVSLMHHESGRVRAVVCHDELSGDEFTLATKLVVNATGVWADDVIAMAESAPSHLITPAKGVHISVARERLRTDIAAVFNVPGDRRSVFVVPFDEAEATFIGTTDTAYDGALDNPLCTPEDIDYLLDAVNASTTAQLTRDDIIGLWAGLRPLLAPAPGSRLSERTADLSRRHQVHDTGDGVVHITGGKWTTYRQMAEDAVNALKPYVANLTGVRTKKLRLHGTGAWRPSTPLEEHLYRRYGSDSQLVLAIIDENSALAAPVIPGQSYVGAEFVFAARHEMATSLIDLVTRRTRAHLHDARRTLEAADSICSMVARDMGWANEDCIAQLRAYRSLVEREFTSAGLAL
ncbi:MAG TPA: glycerol-3-phosphate dehydrogenase/oxidase [Acidimicrobiales bacterium]|nr:glycerol-3-phosphate dehydrogenase/oxidase [Acidimicrobiales bacterium]